MTGFFDLSGTDAVLAVAAAAAAVAWLVAAGILFVGRRPSEPRVGPRTLELGPEPPAVANSSSTASASPTTPFPPR